jgi:hypothetical protein
LDNTSKQTILAHFNAVSPETFDQGDFGPWSFSDLKLVGDKYVLSFSNAAGQDSIRFGFAGSPLGAGGVSAAFSSAVTNAIEQWEAVERGDDDEDEDEEDDLDDEEDDLDDEEDDLDDDEDLDDEKD